MRAPTIIWLSGPALPPLVTSTGRLRFRMRDMRAAETRKLTALLPNTAAGEPTSRSTAPIAGLTIVTSCSIVSLSAFAAASSSSLRERRVAAAAGG